MSAERRGRILILDTLNGTIARLPLVERMLKLHKDLPKARTAQDKTAIERQIAATDKQIDALVHKLFGLTEPEVRIVEGD